MNKYSPFLETLHDPVRRPSKQANWLDFAVIWDEDHDTRVIDAVMGLHVAGLLSPVLFVGERKGTLSLVRSDRTLHDMGRSDFADYEGGVTSICRSLDDPWTTSVEPMSACGAGIISDKAEKVQLYMSTINMLWSLGTKPMS